MTVPESVPQSQEKTNDKELNFRHLEAKYQRELEKERSARMELERRAEEALRQVQSSTSQDDEDDNSEPYVDHKKLNKKLSQHNQNTKSEIEKAMEMAKKSAKDELKQEMWLEQNPDFREVLGHASALIERNPTLAKSILNMPDNFERQQLVYQTIKDFGYHKPPEAKTSIQEKVDANKRSPYYQPSGMSSAPYANVSDFSDAGKKQAYEKMQQLKKNLRI
jgi:hypothetical protein